MKSKRHNGMRRRNGSSPAAEPLETRRMLSIVPLPAGLFQPYILENGTGSNWTIQNRNGTTNGLPVGGSRTNTGGLGVFTATYDTDHSHPFDFGHSVWVNDSIFMPPGGVLPNGEPVSGLADVTGYKDANDREHLTRLSAGPASMSAGPTATSPLNVSVEYYAAQQSATLRTLARFDNPGLDPVSTNVTFVYNLGSDANTKITGTSNGDAAFTTADRWLVTDDIPPTVGDAVPAVTGVLRGPAPSALAPSAVSNVVFSAAGTEGVLARYDITVPAGETRYLMFFTQLSHTAADGLIGARAFDVAP
jgi:hypothetical protein